jgi:hypothetical protein
VALIRGAAQARLRTQQRNPSLHIGVSIGKLLKSISSTPYPYLTTATTSLLAGLRIGNDQRMPPPEGSLFKRQLRIRPSCNQTQQTLKMQAAEKHVAARKTGRIPLNDTPKNDIEPCSGEPRDRPTPSYNDKTTRIDIFSLIERNGGKSSNASKTHNETHDPNKIAERIKENITNVDPRS